MNPSDKLNELLEAIFHETMEESGFLWKIRENEVDQEGFSRFINALNELTEIYQNENELSKILVACLFEVPWSIENAVDFYMEKDQALGQRVLQMADEARAAIMSLLWTGLEKYYE